MDPDGHVFGCCNYRSILPQEQLSSSAQASFEFTCTSVEEAMFWDCNVNLATASKMPGRLRLTAICEEGNHIV